jgi:hypothetical protein
MPTTIKPTTPTAREKLTPSVLRQTQLELMGEDVDLTRFYLKMTTRKQGFNAVEAISDIQIERTIQGASTVTVTVEDREGILLNSGQLAARNDVEIDGLFFRLVSIAKSGQELTLTFEDREVSLLRTYAKPIKQSLATARTRITRAQFVLRMIREVKEEKIAWVIPELTQRQAIDTAAKLPPDQVNFTQKGAGIPAGTFATVKNVQMSAAQRKNANTICQVGLSMHLPREYLVMAIMCATQESSINNLKAATDPNAYNFLGVDPNGNPVGCFQQIKKWGWPASRDVAKDAAAFYQHLIPVVQKNPTQAYEDSIEAVQRSGNPTGYGQWRDEAERTVTAFGVTTGPSTLANSQWRANTASPTYEFYRGLPPSGKVRKQKYGGRWGPENSWDCIQRLAQEVQWRAFFVSGTFYFISEDDLFKSQPIAIIDEFTAGVDSIDGDYDEGSKVATLTVNCRIKRWAAPPGSVIEVRNMGPWNGRWLVNDVTRSAFSTSGQITLKKPLPRLPEPSQSNLVSSQTNSQTWHLAQTPSGVPGQAFIPNTNKTGIQSIDKAYEEALQINAQKLPYVWGGGHASAGTPDGGHLGGPGGGIGLTGYDCSGGTGAVLAAGGMGYNWGGYIPGSTDMESWGAAGPGKYMTVYANSVHVFIVFTIPPNKAQHFGTGQWGGNKTWSGPGFQAELHPTAGFVARHWPGT